MLIGPLGPWILMVCGGWTARGGAGGEPPARAVLRPRPGLVPGPRAAAGARLAGPRRAPGGVMAGGGATGWTRTAGWIGAGQPRGESTCKTALPRRRVASVAVTAARRQPSR